MTPTDPKRIYHDADDKGTMVRVIIPDKVLNAIRKRWPSESVSRSVARAVMEWVDGAAELDRLREADVLLRDAEYELVWTGGARDFNSSDGDAHEGWVKGPKAVVDRIRRYFRKVISFICDRCGCEWVVQTTDGKDDVFYKVQEDMGRLVCPECLGWAKELDADDTN